MASNNGLKEQLRRNAVALISLTIAITSLGYNTWRNEASEHNRNQRLVSIQILVMLGDFQQVVLDRRYDQATDGESARRKGWALARTLRDISMVAEGDVPDSAEKLFEIWARDSRALRSSDDAQTEIEAAIDAVRHDTHEVLRNLD